MLHLLLDGAGSEDLMLLLLEELLVLFPGLHGIHIPSSIDLEEAGLQQLVEVAVQRRDLVLLLLHDVQLVLHLLDAGQLLGDLMLPMRLHPLLLF